MARKHATNRREKAFELELMDPAAFPDLDSVREFLAGEGGAVMYESVRFAVMPARDSIEFPEHMLQEARWAAWHLAHDLRTLARVLAEGQPARAKLASAHCTIGRSLLLALMLSGPFVQERKPRAQLAVRYLADRAEVWA